MERAISKRIGTITVQSTPEAAAQAIRDAIITGELKGGDRIVEQKWAARLGIGQPTLREALKELEYQGLLTKLPQRGTYVSQLSPADYRSILEVRIPLEALAIGRAAVRFTPEVEEELTALAMKMAGSGSDMDVSTFHDCDVAFHRRIWEVADNEYLRIALEALTFRLFVFSVVGRWPNAPNASAERLASVQQHLGILEGLRTRNPASAREAFIHHTVRYWNAQYGLDLIEPDFVVFDLASSVSARGSS
jgi:DNA-binding GntR family transcriptional regulator